MKEKMCRFWYNFRDLLEEKVVDPMRDFAENHPDLALKVTTTTLCLITIIQILNIMFFKDC